MESGNMLREKLEAAISDVPGRVGIAVISPEGDTLTVNNSGDYQLMSVFKLHQALAVAHTLDLQGVSLDTVIRVCRTEFDPDTWSPVLTEKPDSLLSLTVTEWLSYLLQQSDNNVSNMLFQRIASVAATDSFIRASTGIKDFRLTVMEEQMHRDHSLADGNRSTPLACASLIRKVFTDSLVSPAKQEAIRRSSRITRMRNRALSQTCPAVPETRAAQEITAAMAEAAPAAAKARAVPEAPVTP